jgi:hypothetical protein
MGWAKIWAILSPAHLVSLANTEVASVYICSKLKIFQSAIFRKNGLLVKVLHRFNSLVANRNMKRKEL